MRAPFFEVLEHPADIGFRAYADTLPALYVHAALAMLLIAGDPAEVEPRQGFPLAVESSDRESLMVDWLSEVLYWYDGKRVAFHDFRVMELEEGAIRAIGIGEPWDPVRHIPKLIVKAVTYHQLKVELREGIWVAEVFLDV
jgi:SHS2 domain-containing protein